MRRGRRRRLCPLCCRPGRKLPSPRGFSSRHSRSSATLSVCHHDPPSNTSKRACSLRRHRQGAGTQKTPRGGRSPATRNSSTRKSQLFHLRWFIQKNPLRSAPRSTNPSSLPNERIAVEVHSTEHASHEAPLPPDTRAPTLTSVIATQAGEREAKDFLATANAVMPPGGKVPEVFTHRCALAYSRIVAVRRGPYTAVLAHGWGGFGGGRGMPAGFPKTRR